MARMPTGTRVTPAVDVHPDAPTVGVVAAPTADEVEQRHYECGDDPGVALLVAWPDGTRRWEHTDDLTELEV